jgi:Asp-tRNA(Asn)/Glu-tRNA(Gln) amidotransferase A subunit family amidase
MRYLRAVQAKEIDRKLSVGLDPGLLAGIPFGIKVVSCCMCALEPCFSSPTSLIF